MTLGALYKETVRFLTEAGIGQASFEASCLFEDLLGIPRGNLFLRPNVELVQEHVERLQTAVEKRVEGYPLQYILGKWEFFGLPFFVGEGVLIPRPETELLVETVLAFGREADKPHIIDLCGGSGCIGIAVGKNLPKAKVDIAEISHEALVYGEKNIAHNRTNNVKCYQLDVLNEKAPDTFEAADCIVSNPPYVTKAEMAVLQKEVRYEPELALDGGGDGLTFYREIPRIWKKLLEPGGLLAFEIGYLQGGAVRAILEEHGFENIQVKQDYSGNDRVVTGIFLG